MGRLGWVRGGTITTILVVIVLMIGVGPAGATNFGSQGTPGSGGTTNGVFLTNNKVFFIAKIGLTGSTAFGVDSAASDFNGVTDFSASSATDSVCSDAAYDACVFDENFGNNGFAAWNACAGSATGSHPNMQCSLSWVRINLHYFVPLTQLACHELGHAVGLRHNSNTASCVNTASSSSTLSAHDEAHLTNEY